MGLAVSVAVLWPASALPSILLSALLARLTSVNAQTPLAPGPTARVATAEELTAAVQSGAKHIVVTADLDLSRGTGGAQAALPVAASTLSIRVCILMKSCDVGPSAIYVSWPIHLHSDWFPCQSEVLPRRVFHFEHRCSVDLWSGYGLSDCEQVYEAHHDYEPHRHARSIISIESHESVCAFKEVRSIGRAWRNSFESLGSFAPVKILPKVCTQSNCDRTSYDSRASFVEQPCDITLPGP